MTTPVGAVGVANHLGLSGGPAGEVDLHHVVLVRVGGDVAVTALVKQTVPVQPTNLKLESMQ